MLMPQRRCDLLVGLKARENKYDYTLHINNIDIRQVNPSKRPGPDSPLTAFDKK
jgi:hypothetical protein